MIRTLSFTEVSRALRCMAQWDFAYGGHLAGSALVPKRVAPRLSEGRAWGAALAALHANMLHDPGPTAVEAMDESLDADAERQREFGVHVQEDHDALRMHLLGMLNHYLATADVFPVEPVAERELICPIPSRGGRRRSSRYRLLAYVDSFRWLDGRAWLVEYKLRGVLSSVEQIALSRQIRWYAWAWWQVTGERVAGVEVIERWNEVPRPPRLVKTGRKDGSLRPSHATDQLTTADAYRAVCAEYDEEPNPDTAAAFDQRRWQQRVPILFRDGELEEAGDELVAAAKLIRDLDSGEMMALRNPTPVNCGGCGFREICPAPDNDLVDTLYERVEPKRYRKEEAAA